MGIRDTIRENSAWSKSDSWAKKIKRYGVEKDLDVEVVITMNAEIHTGISLTRWRRNADVKAKVIAARDALNALNDAMVKDFWATVEPKRGSSEHV